MLIAIYIIYYIVFFKILKFEKTQFRYEIEKVNKVRSMKFLAETFFVRVVLFRNWMRFLFFRQHNQSTSFPFWRSTNTSPFPDFFKKRRNFNSFENGIQKSEWKFNGLCDFDFFKLYVCLFVIEKIYTVLTRLTLRLWRTWKCVLLRSNKVGPSLSTIILTIWLSSKLALVF